MRIISEVPRGVSIVNKALRHIIAQGGLCGHISHCGQRPVVSGGPGCCLGHQPSPVQCPHFHAEQTACMLPAGGVGPAGVPLAGAVGITSRSASVSVCSWRGYLPRLWSPSTLMILCAASSV